MGTTRRRRLDTGRPAVHPHYRDGQRKRLLPLLCVGATAGAALMLAFALWDRQFDPMHLETTLAVRAVVAAILLGISAASMTRLASAVQDFLVVVALWASVLGIMVIGGMIHGHFEGTPAALMLVMLFGSASAGDLRVQAAAGLGYLPGAENLARAQTLAPRGRALQTVS